MVRHKHEKLILLLQHTHKKPGVPATPVVDAEQEGCWVLLFGIYPMHSKFRERLCQENKAESGRGDPTFSSGCYV